MNEDEILDFARLTIDTERHVRFIECMPVGSVNFWDSGKYVTTDEIRRIIETLGPCRQSGQERTGLQNTTASREQKASLALSARLPTITAGTATD